MIQEKLFHKKIESGQTDHAYLLVSSDESILQTQIDYLIDQLSYTQFEIVNVVPEEKKNGEITIGKMKALRAELANKASSGKRLVIIRSAQKINTEAANSFLKTLEEPPKDTIIVMLSGSRNILPTLISRSQVYQFPALKRDFLSFQPEDIEKMIKSSLKERFATVDRIVKENQVEALIEDLLTYYHQKLKTGERVEGILNRITQAKKHYQANVGAKLVLENILLSV